MWVGLEFYGFDEGNFIFYVVMENRVDDVYWIYDELGGWVYDLLGVIFEFDYFYLIFWKCLRFEIFWDGFMCCVMKLVDWKGFSVNWWLDIDWDMFLCVEILRYSIELCV